jgi:integrase
MRNNGIYYIVTSGKRGRRVWTSLHTKDEGDANTLFEEHEREHRRKTRLFLSSFGEDFRQRQSLNYSPRNLEIHAACVKNFIRLCGDKPISRIATYDAEAYRQLRAKKVSPVTVNIELRSLKAAFNDAKRLGLIVSNPFQDVKPVRITDEEQPFLDEFEFQKLLEAIDDSDFRNLVIFTIITMMRRGEVIHLRWKDVDLQRKVIMIRNHEGFRVKGGKSRMIPMSDWLYAFLSHRQRRSEYVFSDENGKPLLRDTVSKKFKRYVRKAKLNEDLHFHSLRHSGISLRINRGVSPAFVQQIAGHSSLLTTEIYTHYENRNLIEAVNNFPLLDAVNL